MSYAPLTTLCRTCGMRVTRFYSPVAGYFWKHDGYWAKACEPKPTWFWNRWVGRSDAGPPIMWMRKLFTLGQWSFFLHLIVGTDHLDCYHTHPATAYRLILWGGYCEELEDDKERVYSRWLPLRFGKVTPDLSHRIHRVYGRRCLTLWIRGPVTHKIKLRGEGWNHGR